MEFFYVVGDHLHNAKDGNREQQTPYPPPEEQCDTYRPCMHFFDLAGHPGDDEYANRACGSENIHKMLWAVSRDVERSIGDGCGDVIV